MSGPISVTSRPISDDDRRQLKEQEAIRLGVADVTFAWADVENRLVVLLSKVIRDPQMLLASAIYFAPSGIEVRTTIVDCALRRLVSSSPAGPLIIKEWKSLLNRLKHLRTVRNKVAHGQMAIFGGRGGYARLTSPIFKMDDNIMESITKGQKPGLGSNELKNSVASVIEASTEIQKFSDYVDLIYSGDSATLLQRLGSLKDGSRSPDLQGTQTPKEP